jgi:hypothetical protein
VNPEKTKYMLMSRYQKAEQRHGIRILSRSFEDVAEFKYLGTTLTDQNCIHKGIKSRLNSCMLPTSQFSLLSSHLLSMNVRVKIFKYIILPVVLYGY